MAKTVCTLVLPNKNRLSYKSLLPYIYFMNYATATAMATATTGRRAVRKGQTRSRLLEVGVRLFAECGYDETSIEVISEAADVSRQTFFNYFPAKEDIVHAWVEQRREQVRSGLDSAEGADWRSRLVSGLTSVASLYDADAEISRPMVRHWVRCGGPTLAGADATADLFEDVFKDGQRAGYIAPDLNSQVISRVLLDVYLGCLYRWATIGGSLRQQLLPAIKVVLTNLGDHDTSS